MNFTSLALTENDIKENLSLYGNIAGQPFIFYRVGDLIQIQDPNDIANNITLFSDIISSINDVNFTLMPTENATFPFSVKQLGREWTIAFSEI